MLVNDPASRAPRATQDVDLAIQIATRIDYYEIEDLLRGRGFHNAVLGPICRFVRPPLILDVIPSDPDILGFSNSWYPAAIGTAERKSLPNKTTINLITAACFLATKL